MQREVENLNKVIENPIKPSLAIIGGAKIETKLPLIEKFQKIYDTVLIGGKIANEAEEQGLKFESNVMIPVDFAKDKLDIGPESIKQFKETISHAKTIVWNGPMGKFEEQPYDTGTNEILSAVISSGAFSVMGGGESIQILEESNNLSKISFVSTGGGAMLEYLTQGTLPGIDALRS
jgi:phosphoglycerate kinase